MYQPNLEAEFERLKSDHHDALAAIFNAKYVETCQHIYRLVQDQNTTKDLAQKVFIRLWEKRHQIKISTSPGAYLRRMAINEALGYLRSRKTLASTDDLNTIETSCINDNFQMAELESQINLAIKALPEKRQLIFILSRYEELSYREIALELDISIKTVENQMGKALKFLRAALVHVLNE